MPQRLIKGVILEGSRYDPRDSESLKRLAGSDERAKLHRRMLKERGLLVEVIPEQPPDLLPDDEPEQQGEAGVQQQAEARMIRSGATRPAPPQDADTPNEDPYQEEEPVVEEGDSEIPDDAAAPEDGDGEGLSMAGQDAASTSPPAGSIAKGRGKKSS